MEECKDCPKCGGEGQLWCDPRDMYFVSCRACDFSAPPVSTEKLEEAIFQWNQQRGGFEMGVVKWVRSRCVRLVERNKFIDVVSGKGVNLYCDRNGDYWLAESPWHWFRVRKSLP